MYIPQKQTTTSPRARELSRKLEQTIEEFERHYPGTSRSDIHQALQALETRVLPASQQAYESIGKAYRAGEIDILALLDAQRTWLETRMNRLELLYDRENGRIAVNRLTAAPAASN